MTLIEAYGLTLRERVHHTKALARSHPTRKRITAYGRALMDLWALGPVLFSPVSGLAVERGIGS